MDYLSWGRLPKVEQAVKVPYWSDELSETLKDNAPFLCQGLARSYGDSCLNDQGTLIVTSELNRIISFDHVAGVLHAEAGFSLADAINFAVPRGWFLPVSPGTKFVTLGGAIANDIHGKNHHSAGTFGCHVLELRLLRSDGSIIECSPKKNSEYFCATVAGLGLTGVILDCKVQLKPIQSRLIDAEFLQFKGLDHFYEISNSSSKNFEYTVAWLDCVASGKDFGRGVFIRGNHAPQDGTLSQGNVLKKGIPVPFDFPEFALNNLSIKAFNTLYFHKQLKPFVKNKVGFDSFFYPLDGVSNWNRIYGKRGFYQFQCVLPPAVGKEALKEIMKEIVSCGNASFLAVLKEFADYPSPGLMSFPRAGTTLCLDFPQAGGRSQKLLARLESMVREAQGAMYPAKDALMQSDSFKQFYPRWEEFLKYRDPAFSSCFSRRVLGV